MEWTGNGYGRMQRREEEGEDKEAAKMRVCGKPHLLVTLTSLFLPEFQQRQLSSRDTQTLK